MSISLRPALPHLSHRRRRPSHEIAGYRLGPPVDLAPSLSHLSHRRHRIGAPATCRSHSLPLSRDRRPPCLATVFISAVTLCPRSVACRPRLTRHLIHINRWFKWLRRANLQWQTHCSLVCRTPVHFTFSWYVTLPAFIVVVLHVFLFLWSILLGF